MAKHSPPPGWQDPLAPQQPLTRPHWLATAIVATLLFAAACVYVSVCLLFWQGQWQLVFHPSRSISATPAAAGIPFEEVTFDATETGVLQLHGWWMAAGTPSAHTVLVMHDGTGSLSDTVPHLQALHGLGVNVFAFDYRGFGRSVAVHPSETRTQEDAEAAWRYLTDTRRVPPGTIVLDGVGLGAALAAETARRHPEAPGLVLEEPQPPVLATLQKDAKLRWLPVRLLFHDRFDAGPALAQLRTPKLFLDNRQPRDILYYDQAAQPKQKALLAGSYGDAAYQLAWQRFLGKYLPRS